MSAFLTAHWQFFATAVISVLGAGIGLWRFLSSRRGELSWRRTEFLFEQSTYLESDAELNEALQLIGGLHPAGSVEQVLSAQSSTLDDGERLRLTHAVDKFLNFFDRLYYAFQVAETLQLAELKVFSWYLDFIRSSPALREYCEERGFADVLELADRVLGQDGVGESEGSA
jgi:hypothetical protein